MSEDINVTDGTVLECLNNKVDLDGGNYLGSGLEEVIKENYADTSLSNLNEAGQAILNGKADISQLSNKANTDASNFTAAGKETVVGWGMPDYSAGVDMGAGTTHTATRKGWVMFKTSTAPGYGVIQINGIEFSKSSNGTYGTAFDTVQEFIPVDVGDTFFITNNASAVCIFYPCKGAK